MTETKELKVGWVKITTTMFDDEKIKVIDSMPDRDALLIIWIKLIAQAGKCNARGFIFLTENIPFTPETLATVFNRPQNTVRLALETFQKLGMIEWDGGRLALVNWEKHQNIDGMDKIREQNRIRQQKRRLELVKGDVTLIRDDYTCQYCGERATGVDHLLPESQGGLSIPENEVACCIRCNQKKMTQTPAYFLNGIINFHEFEIRFDLIENNPILKQFVKFNKELGIFEDVTEDVTRQLINSHALEVEEEGELEEDITTKKESSKESFEHYVENILKDEFLDVDVDEELKKFHLWWSEGKKKLKRPRLAFRNWLLKARQYKKDHSNGGYSGKSRTSNGASGNGFGHRPQEVTGHITTNEERRRALEN